MYVSGDGSTPGALGEQRSMNLYLARVPSNAMSLYIQGPGSPANQQTTLFARGAVIPTGTMPLSMPDVVGPVSLAGKLYTHGF
jgi:hypothetical protein